LDIPSRFNDDIIINTSKTPSKKIKEEILNIETKLENSKSSEVVNKDKNITLENNKKDP
jgi:hypothetical protein